MEQTNSAIDIKTIDSTNKSPQKSRKNLFIIIGVAGAIVLITAIVLIIVLATRKKNNSKVNRIPSNPKTNDDLSTQSIEMMIEGNEESKKVRLLQSNVNKIQIFGNNFNELNSDEATMLINGKNYKHSCFIYFC